MEGPPPALLDLLTLPLVTCHSSFMFLTFVICVSREVHFNRWGWHFLQVPPELSRRVDLVSNSKTTNCARTNYRLWVCGPNIAACLSPKEPIKGYPGPWFFLPSTNGAENKTFPIRIRLNTPEVKILQNWAHWFFFNFFLGQPILREQRQHRARSTSNVRPWNWKKELANLHFPTIWLLASIPSCLNNYWIKLFISQTKSIYRYLKLYCVNKRWIVKWSLWWLQTSKWCETLEF